jgi:hypothetical protein
VTLAQKRTRRKGARHSTHLWKSPFVIPTEGRNLLGAAAGTRARTADSLRDTPALRNDKGWGRLWDCCGGSTSPKVLSFRPKGGICLRAAARTRAGKADS